MRCCQADKECSKPAALNHRNHKLRAKTSNPRLFVRRVVTLAEGVVQHLMHLAAMFRRLQRTQGSQNLTLRSKRISHMAAVYPANLVMLWNQVSWRANLHASSSKVWLQQNAQRRRGAELMAASAAMLHDASEQASPSSPAGMLPLPEPWQSQRNAAQCLCTGIGSSSSKDAGTARRGGAPGSCHGSWVSSRPAGWQSSSRGSWAAECHSACCQGHSRCQSCLH